MRKLLMVALATCGLCCVLAAPPVAQADCGYGNYLGGFGYGFSPRMGSYMGSPYAIPYYALHPPVYYSHAVPRTFGYSPFAYPGGYRTPEVVESEAEMIINPHVDEPTVEPQPTATSMQTAATPLEVINPYVNTSADDSAGIRYTQSK